MTQRKNGCHNRAPFQPAHKMQHGWDGSKRVMQWVPFRMKPDCDYTHTALGQADKGCEGCKWRAEPS